MKMKRVALLPLLVLSLAACDLFGGAPTPNPDPDPDPNNPSVDSVSPEDGAQTISTDVSVIATLTLPNGAIDEDSVGNQTVTLTPEGADSAVSAAVSVSGNTVTLNPSEPLDFSTRYTFVMLASVRDVSGASLVAHSSTFRTAAEDEEPVTPMPPPGSATLEYSAERLIFEAQNNQTSAPQTLTLSNTGAEGFTLSSLELASDQFTLSALELPIDIATGESVEVEVAFKPTSLGPQMATLTVNGGSSPEVELRGLSVEGDGGNEEPSLQWIFDTFELPINTGDENPETTPIADSPSSEELNSALGDEVLIGGFQKAGTGEVTVEVLAAYGVDNTPVTEFGWYTLDDAESGNRLFDVESGADNAQTLNPSTDGTLSFDPGSAGFGFYSFWPTNEFFQERTVYSQDDLNTFADAIPHQVRVYPYATADGVEPNAYVLATEEFTQGFDYNDIVVVVRNVEPLDNTCGQVEPIVASRVLSETFGNLNVQNLSGAPFADRLVFSRIGNISEETFGNKPESFPFANLKCHDLNTLRLENTGSSALDLSLSITGTDADVFALPSGTNLSIPGGSSEDLVVQFVEDSAAKGVRNATLQLQGGSETVEVELAGIYQRAPEGSREIFLGGVVEAFGYSTDIGTASDGSIASAFSPDDSEFTGPAGDEVISKLWQRANPSEPVYIRQIAAFHSCCGSSSNDDLRVVVSGDVIGQFEHAERYGQSVLPPVQGSDAEAAEMSVEPSGPFELIVRNSYSTDWETGRRNNGNLGVRFWPVERNGSTAGFENSYIVAQDFVENGCGTSDTANCDFNDNMYLITNVSPVSPRQ